MRRLWLVAALAAAAFVVLAAPAYAQCPKLDGVVVEERRLHEARLDGRRQRVVDELGPGVVLSGVEAALP